MEQLNCDLADLAQEDFTVLLVDDEPNMLRSLIRILRPEPYKIITAGSGAEGLEILGRECVQMIISDQRMPEMTGTEFLEQVLKLYPETIRVILTGYSELKTAEDAINRGEIYRFLNKPWNDDDLKTTIRQGLLKWRLEHENRRLLGIITEQNKQLRQWNEKLEQLVEERTRDLKEAQAQLIQNEKMASLGVLAGGVAHEINNPLGGILGITQLMLMSHPAEGELTEDLKNIEAATLHCAEIVKNLLQFSRKSDPEAKDPISVTHLLDQVLLLIGHVFRQEEIEVCREFPQDFPMIKVNARQFQQVLLNLLVNAQQAMPQSGKVTVRGRETDTGEVLIEVQDQGIGIPESIRDKIFDPFFTTKQEGEGTGLGLSIVYRIIQEHAGRIEIDSEVGRGTSIRLILPEQIKYEAARENKFSEAELLVFQA